MPSANAWILDVGHGNAAVLESDGSVAVIDGGRGTTLMEFLEGEDFHSVECVMISHADADHSGGIQILLSDEAVAVGDVYLNGDHRSDESFNDLVSALLDAKRRGTRPHLFLNRDEPGTVHVGALSLEVLAPTFELAVHTTAGFDEESNRLNANALSAVVRAKQEGGASILFCADVDGRALQSLDPDGSRCDVLVFPHHGGRPGTEEPRVFAKNLIQLTQPKTVVFSIGRQYGNPRPDIVSEVLAASADVHIACTQLSTRCAGTLPPSDELSELLLVAPAKGRRAGACCAGTIKISLDDSALAPGQEAHAARIVGRAVTPLCRPDRLRG